MQRHDAAYCIKRIRSAAREGAVGEIRLAASEVVALRLDIDSKDAAGETAAYIAAASGTANAAAILQLLQSTEAITQKTQDLQRSLVVIAVH